MEKLSGNSMTTKFSIRLLQKELQDHIQILKKNVPEETVFDLSVVCDNVKEKILNYEDDIFLSKTQNNYRRIHIASELCLEISLAYGNSVDLEFKKIVFDLLKVKKFQKISRGITKKKKWYLDNEKQFNEAALSRLLSYSKENEIVQGEVEKSNEIKEKEVPSCNQLERIYDGSPKSNILEQFSTSENVTELRYQTSDISNAHIYEVGLPEEATNLLLTSIKEPNAQFDDQSYMCPIPESLDDPLISEIIPEINQPDSTANAIKSNKKAVEKDDEIQESIQNEHLNIVIDGVNGDELNEDEFWNFPEIKPEKKKKKKERLLFKDQRTYIENYAARALRLNRNICVERVQVYEGPPKILKSMSVMHMMTNSGFRSSISPDKRNSKLNLLYNRHLHVEEKVPETLSAEWKREIRKEGQSERNMMNIGMNSICRNSEILPQAFTNEILVEEDLDLRPNKQTDRESLRGVPMSRIIQPVIQPVSIKNITTSPLSTPRIQQFHGKKGDSVQNGFWFYSAEKNPPGKKWKKFGYVIQKIKASIHGTKTEISVKELLLLENDLTAVNFLTLLRVLDKLALEKILVLKFKQGDIVITSFQYPHAAEMNYAL